MSSATSLTPNPAMVVRLLGDESAAHARIAVFARRAGAGRIELAGEAARALWSLLRGAPETVSKAALVELWTKRILLAPAERQELPFVDAPVVIRDGDAEDAFDSERLAVHVLPDEWQAVVRALEAAPALVSPDAAAALAADGFAELRSVAGETVCTAVSSYYRRLAALGFMASDEAIATRLVLHGDPVGRRVLRWLLPAAERTAARPLQATYPYAAIYVRGTALAMHTDRAQCEYTVSLTIDYRSAGARPPQPWPLLIERPGGGPPASVHLRVGDAVIFRGRRLRHGRPPLPDGDSSCMLMSHYVHPEFSGSLD